MNQRLEHNLLMTLVKRVRQCAGVVAAAAILMAAEILLIEGISVAATAAVAGVITTVLVPNTTPLSLLQDLTVGGFPP